MANVSVPSPQVAGLATSPAQVLWSNGEPFDGYVWLGLVLPVGYTATFLWATQRPLQLPQFIKVPIIGGIIDPTTQIYYNANLNPANTSYVAYFFDRIDNLIAPASGTAVPFTVTANPTTLVVPALTIPAAGTPPVPQS